MVEFGNNLDPDEEYDVLLNILDFPIECVEGDEVAVDWDISNAQFLGPIPSNVLLELPMTSNEELNAPNSFPRPAAPIAAAPKHVDSSSLRIPRQRKFAKVQSPVSVLESNGSCYREKGLSIKSEHAIPARSRSKRVRYSGINPWLLTARELSKCKRTSNARSKESRKRLFQQPISIDLMRKSPENVDNSLTVLNPARQVASNPRDALVKKCAHCQSTETPLWREGPLGPKTLCNACGVRYRSGRLFPEYRPAASPTFVPSQHSNSHRKVEEMRTEAKRLKVKIKIGGAPVQKQLIMPVERVQLAKNVDTSSSPKRKLLAKYDDTSSSQIPLQNKTANVQKSCAFSTQSSVSLLQSSSYLRYRSKYVEPAGVNPGLPPSSCKKASNSMRGKESRKKLFEAPVAVAVAVDVMKNSPINEDASLDVLDPVRLQNVSNSMRGKDSRKKLCQLPVAVAVDVMKNSHKNDETSLDVSDPVCLLNASNSTRGKESRKKILQLPFAIDVMKNSPRNDEASLGVSDPAPLQNASNTMRGKESRKKLCKLPVAVDVMKNSHKNSKTPLDVPNPVHRQNGSNPSCPAIIKKCAHCQSTKTPQWREGLLGPQTLCNACGLRYRSGRLLPEYRPAASPTFMPSQNSNSHRKLMQMRVEAM